MKTRRFNATPGDLTGGKPCRRARQRRLGIRRKSWPVALQDLKRATVLGTRSSQGLGTDDHPLGDAGALTSETALYYNAVRQVDSGTGITPASRWSRPLRRASGARWSAGANPICAVTFGPRRDEEGSARSLTCRRKQGRHSAELCVRPVARQEDDPPSRPNPDRGS